MRILGIDFKGKDLNYVVATREGDFVAFDSSGRITLADTRAPDALLAFQKTLETVVREARPGLVAVKWKPEKGKMGAGPAALKMEALVLVASPCAVDFVTPQRLRKVDRVDNGLREYVQDAVLAVLAAR